MGNHEGGSHRLGALALHVGLEGIPAVIDVPAGATLHEAVLGAVPLELGTYDDVVDTGVEAVLVGSGDGVHVTEVTVGEGIDTDGGKDTILVIAASGHTIVGHDVYRGEGAALVGTGLELVGVSHTQHVVALAQTGVELGGDGGEVLLLIVTGGLIEESVNALAAGAVAVEGNVLAVRADEGGIVTAYGAHGSRRHGGVEVLGVAEADIETVGVVDVPVQTGHYLPVRSLEVVTLVAAGIVTEFLLNISGHGFHLLNGRTVGRNAGTPLFGCALAGYAGRTGSGIEGVLTVHEEEEFVLDDGAADGGTDGVVQALAAFYILTSHFVTVESVGGIVVVYGSVPLVGTGLGNSVDGTAGETALADIERSDVHVDLLQGVQGDRRTAGREVLADTEGVVESSTVNGDGGTAVVAAAHCETAGGGRGLRSEGHDVVHAAGDRRDALNLAGGDAGGSTIALAAETGLIGYDHSFGELLGSFCHPGVQSGLFTKLQGNIVEDDSLVTHVGDFDGVGTTGTHAGEEITTIYIGNGTISGTGRSVRCNNCSTDHSFSLFIGNDTAEGGGGHLSKGDAARNQRSDCKQKSFEEILHK